MNKRQRALRKVFIVNDFEFFGKQPYLHYFKAASRDVSGSGWRLTWRGNGQKIGANEDSWRLGADTIWIHGMGSKWDTFEEAKTQAEKLTGVKEWVASPFGSYGDKEFVEKRLTYLMALSKRAKFEYEQVVRTPEGEEGEVVFSKYLKDEDRFLVRVSVVRDSGRTVVHGPREGEPIMQSLTLEFYEDELEPIQ